MDHTTPPTLPQSKAGQLSRNEKNSLSPETALSIEDLPVPDINNNMEQFVMNVFAHMDVALYDFWTLADTLEMRITETNVKSVPGNPQYEKDNNKHSDDMRNNTELDIFAGLDAAIDDF